MIVHAAKSSVGASLASRMRTMLKLSDTDVPDNPIDIETSWETERPNWAITGHKIFETPITDTFCNHPRNVILLSNTRSGKTVSMGTYDAASLFPDEAPVIGALGRIKKRQRFTRRSFETLANIVIKTLDLKKEFELKDQFASLVFLANYLKRSDRDRLSEIINLCLADQEGNFISARDRNFIIYKSQETCMNHRDLIKYFSYLRSQTDEEHRRILSEEQAQIATKILTIRKRGASSDRLIDSELKRKERELKKSEYTFLNIYRMECNYRGINS